MTDDQPLFVSSAAVEDGDAGEGGEVEGVESGGDEAVGEVDVGEVEREVGRAVEAVVVSGRRGVPRLPRATA